MRSMPVGLGGDSIVLDGCYWRTWRMVMISRWNRMDRQDADREDGSEMMIAHAVLLSLIRVSRVACILFGLASTW